MTTIGGLAIVAIGDIEEQFLHHVIIDLNGFEKDSNNYQIIPDYGIDKGMVFALRGAVMGNIVS